MCLLLNNDLVYSGLSCLFWCCKTVQYRDYTSETRETHMNIYARNINEMDYGATDLTTTWGNCKEKQ